MVKPEALQECLKPYIRVIDSMMGSGKTTYIINEINQYPERRYIYVGKYLLETQRIVYSCQNAYFKEPSEDRFGSKQADFHSLVKNGANIAVTHELFKRLEFSARERELIQERGYRLILDEVPEVIEVIPVSNHDRKEILERYAIVGEDNAVVWKVDDYKGNHGELKKQIKSKAVIDFGNSCFLWLFPVELLLSFKEVDVLTFLFEGSHMKSYLDIYHLKHDIFHIRDGKLTPGKQDLFQNLKRVRRLIHIYEGELNEIGEELNAFSSTWWKKNFRGKGRVAELNALNIFQNIYNAKAEEAMWTRFKIEKQDKHKLAGHYYVGSFCPCNACATNVHKERKYLAYLVNVYENPIVMNWFKLQGVKVNEDAYALSQLVQWIWRSAIREGKEIHLYIPSHRMRGLLTAFLQSNHIEMAA